MINYFTYRINVLSSYLNLGFLGNKVWLDSSVLCQLKCPICSTGQNNTGVLGKGYLKFTNFKKFVDRYSFIKNIELSNWGEIFLNPELVKILAYGHSKGIVLTANNGVNFNKASDAQIEALVKYKVRSMQVSIDGATQETYQMYRSGGNINNVMQNINKVNYFKDKYKSQLPILKWQYIIFGHNEGELQLAKEMAEDLGMIFLPKLNGQPDYSPIKDVAQAVNEAGFESWDDHLHKTGEIRNHSCYQLWETPVINWDGKLLGCCRNRFGHFGNVFTNGLKECIKGKKYAYTKKMLMGKLPPRDDVPCVSCHIFDIMKANKIFIKPFKDKNLKIQLLTRIF